jgi:ComF family protein
MAGWLETVCARECWQITMISAVPLGRRRRLRRGYNQAELIAQVLANRIRTPYCGQALRRTRETRSQVGLDPHDRQLNVHNAFAASSELVSGQDVLLVDDLVTTGATMNSCLQAVLDAGARGAYGISVASATASGGV